MNIILHRPILPLSGEDSMQLSELVILCTNLQKQVLDLEKAKDAQAKEIVDLKKRVQVLERKKKSRTTRFKRLRKVGESRRVESSEGKDSLGDHKDASKQGKSIEDIDKDTDVSLVDDTQGRSRVQRKDRSQVEIRTPQESQPSMIKDKGKAIMIEPEVPLKRKDQVALDEDLARNLQAQLEAELIEEERLARKQEEEANIALIESWDNTQAMMEADFELAQRLQTEEQGEITIEERSRLFIELMNKRKKHFAMLRAEEKRRKPPTKAQKRNLMSTYLKNMNGYKHNQLKSKSYEEIQKLFDNEMRRVNNFIPIYSEENMNIAIDANNSLANLKPPVIVEYKLLKEGIMVHYQLIRADGSSKRYTSMIRMLQGIDREDLQTL
ncbi:hypothetical protein Tco_0367503 [Tanacetum coccineum]